jgi:molecular chaperone Hsp33
MAEALRGMGREEVQAILREQGALEADCEFCNAHYHFDAVDVEALFAGQPALSSPGSHQ